MRIAVCDDDALDRKRLCTHIQMYCDRNQMAAHVDGYETGASLLRRMGQDPYSIVFMDIFLKQEHGVDVARVIHQRFENCILIFSTISEDYALDGFALNARHYLVKPIAYPHVENAMDRCADRLLTQARTLQLSSKQKTRVIIRDILFVEVLNKTCFLHTETGVETTRKTIGQLEKELGSESFLRCHRSFIVNMEHIRDYEQTDFVLRNGMRVPIRQAGRNRIKQLYRDYLSMRVSEMV